MTFEPITPDVEGFGRHAQGEVPRPPGPVRGEHVAPEGRLGVEGQEHTLADPEADVAARLLADDVEPEHVPEGEPCDGDDLPCPGRSTAEARDPAPARAAIVPIRARISASKLAPYSRTILDQVVDRAAPDLGLA